MTSESKAIYNPTTTIKLQNSKLKITQGFGHLVATHVSSAEDANERSSLDMKKITLALIEQAKAAKSPIRGRILTLTKGGLLVAIGPAVCFMPLTGFLPSIFSIFKDEANETTSTAREEFLLSLVGAELYVLITKIDKSYLNKSGIPNIVVQHTGLPSRLSMPQVRELVFKFRKNELREKERMYERNKQEGDVNAEDGPEKIYYKGKPVILSKRFSGEETGDDKRNERKQWNPKPFNEYRRNEKTEDGENSLDAAPSEASPRPQKRPQTYRGFEDEIESSYPRNGVRSQENRNKGSKKGFQQNGEMEPSIYRVEKERYVPSTLVTDIFSSPEETLPESEVITQKVEVSNKFTAAVEEMFQHMPNHTEESTKLLTMPSGSAPSSSFEARVSAKMQPKQKPIRATLSKMVPIAELALSAVDPFISKEENSKLNKEDDPKGSKFGTPPSASTSQSDKKLKNPNVVYQKENEEGKPKQRQTNKPEGGSKESTNPTKKQ